MMSALTLDVLAQRIGASYAGAADHLQAVAIDSRAVLPGDLFVALPGARVDGHDFVSAAAERGALAAIVERPVDAPVPCLQVQSSLAALTTIGIANRDFFNGTVVAITGSCGKTTVKNLCRSIFSEAGNTVATTGNYNNEIGVPLTLARLSDSTRYAVVEMGAAGRGHVAHLCKLARPGITTVLNAMEAHLDGFGSVADVADIKAEIYDGLGAQDVAILNLDQPWTSVWESRIAATGAGTLSYSLDQAADLTASDLRDLGLAGSVFTLHAQGESREVTLPLPGRHCVANALAAAALATAAGISIDAIAAGIAGVEVEPGRLQSERLSDGTMLIDDSYNANPGSVRAAIGLLASMDGDSTLILGEMLELGPGSADSHAQMGELARVSGVRRFIGVGNAVGPAVRAFGQGAVWYASREALSSDLPELLKVSNTILVKGSRGSAMEAVLAALREVSEGRASC